MVKSAVERKNEKGESAYAHSIEKVTDTSLAEAVLLNGVIAQTDAAIILSAPATYLAKSLNLNNAKELYKDKCRRLVIVDAGVPQQDIPAIRKVIAEWPTPIIFCPKEVGDSLPFPGSALEKTFEWSPQHPAVDAYKAAGTMSYNAPSYDLAAAHYAVHPDSGFFQLSEAGSLTVSDDGKFSFKPGAGQVQSLKVDPAKKEALMLAMIEVLGTKPAAPQQRTRPPADPKAAAADTPPAPGVIKKDK
jgi:hypothetical protein